MAALTIQDLAGQFHDRIGIEDAGGIGCRDREIRTNRLQPLDPLSRGARCRPGAIPFLQPEGVIRLSSLSESLRNNIIQSLVLSGAPCLLLVSAFSIPPFLNRLSRRFHLPVLASSLGGAHLESRLTGLLREHRDGFKRVHGCLAVASGIGVLIIGDSGMGKTTAALCLAEEKGGAWVADDAVDLSRRGDAIRGRSPAIIRGLVAVRGRGIVRASGLVSRMRIRKKAPVDGVVRLVRRAEERDAAWPGIVKQGEACRILGVERPFCALIVGEGEPVYRRIAGWAASLNSGGRES
jgi:serine kinase of HPr protein (carbohydrate metabolism regulator)